jgi:hypothetical protein
MSIITTATTITAMKIRTLYRDFLHILRHTHPTTSTTNASTPPWQQQLRSEFRKPLLMNDHDDTASSSSAATTTTSTSNTNHNNSSIEERMRYGTSRLAFLRMNAIHYRQREAPSLVMDTTTSAEGAISSSTTAISATIPSKQRFLYKNGQRYDISNPNRNNNMTSSTKRNDKGYIISPYDGKNLDPESVTRHRKNLRRAGFMNNAHAKGIF